MIYSGTLDDGRKLDFKVYDYHYQNSELKEQFVGMPQNVIILFKQENDFYKPLETIVENPATYLYWSLPTDTLNKTTKILIPAFIKSEDEKDDFKRLAILIGLHF